MSDIVRGHPEIEALPLGSLFLNITETALVGEEAIYERTERGARYADMPDVDMRLEAFTTAEAIAVLREGYGRHE